ncbi:MAG: hydrogenase maturation protease [Candidatus Fermentibacteria bacterium]
MLPDQHFVHQLCIIGAGNTLAGDDGAGNIVVSRLKEKYPEKTDILLHNLETDPLELWDVLPCAKRFIFVDAVAGEPAGRLVRLRKRGMRRAWAPSLHNMDIPTVIRQLCILRGKNEPEWRIWGVTIDIPDNLREGLSSAVSDAVEKLVEILSDRIESEDYSVEAPDVFEEFENTC